MMPNQNMGYAGQDMSYLNYLNYINQQNQIQNAMQQQNNRMQVQSQLNGRLVNSIESIVPNEVPMDGSVSVFPKNDYSEIYLKSWNPNGTINTIIYKPVNSDVEQNISKVTLDSLNEDVKNLKEEILERFDRLEKSTSNKQSNSRTKQEDK